MRMLLASYFEPKEEGIKIINNLLIESKFNKNINAYEYSIYTEDDFKKCKEIEKHIEKKRNKRIS